MSDKALNLSEERGSSKLPRWHRSQLALDLDRVRTRRTPAGIEKKPQSWRRISSAFTLRLGILLAILPSCSIEKERSYESECPDLGRKLTKSERVEQALRLIHEKPEVFGSDKSSPLFRAVHESRRDGQGSRVFAQGYLRENPDCCKVLTPPAYISEDWSSLLLDEVSPQRDWNADVLIEKDPSFRGRPWNWLELMSGDCGQINTLWRG